MFGYMTPSGEGFSEERQGRYRAYYCGLCRALQSRHGNLSRVTLSNDMTFLTILLTSLYEPEEETGTGRCLFHPVKERSYVMNEMSAYCADMNVALAYHKCWDDWEDDRSLVGRAEAALLEKAYRQVEARYPEKCAAMESCLRAIGNVEKEQRMAPDEPANLTAQMLGAIFRYKEEFWADTLEALGGALGRFVYLMDAYDDLAADRKKGRYNPLAAYAGQEDYEAFCQESLLLLMAQATEIFETLPLVLDVDILRNILYSGVWTRYHARRRKNEPKDKLLPKEGGR